MKIFGVYSSSNHDGPEPAVVWRDYLQLGLDGFVVELQENICQTLLREAKPELPSLMIRTWVEQLAQQKPAGCCLLLGPNECDTAEWAKTIQHEGLWVSPGVSHNISLIENVAKKNIFNIISVNGLGMKALDELVKVCPGGDPTLCYVASKEDRLTEIMQLTWLKARGYETAFKAESVESIFSAAALGVEVVMLPWFLFAQSMHGRSLVQRIRELGEMARGKGCRPITASEIETVEGIEVCLVAAHHLFPGDRVKISDVIVSRHRRRGVAPYLLSDIVDRKILYSMKPGDPIQFGLLGEKREDG